MSTTRRGRKWHGGCQIWSVVSITLAVCGFRAFDTTMIHDHANLGDSELHISCFLTSNWRAHVRPCPVICVLRQLTRSKPTGLRRYIKTAKKRWHVSSSQASVPVTNSAVHVPRQLSHRTIRRRRVVCVHHAASPLAARKKLCVLPRTCNHTS